MSGRRYNGQIEFGYKGQNFKITFGSMQSSSVIWLVRDEKPDEPISECDHYVEDIPATLVDRAVDKLRSEYAEQRVIHALKA